MNGIEILNAEHQNILRMTEILRKICIRTIKTLEVPTADLRICIEWIRGYADAHHHGKEEEILFLEMEKHGEVAAGKLVSAMHIEHDQGRFHISSLEEALDRWKPGDDDALLDVITHASGYAELLVRHATKEDDVIYPFSERLLSEEIMASVDERSKAFDDARDVSGYDQDLAELKTKYL